MSIIEEALRRLQHGGAEQAPAAAPQPAASAAEPSPAEPTTAAPTGVHSWPTAVPPSPPPPAPVPAALLSVAAVVLTAAVVLGALGIGWVVRQARTPRPESAPVPWPVSPPAATKPRPSPAAPATVLSGVVVGEGEQFAVIDGQVYKEGDQIGEATLIEVTETSARLRRPDGTEVTLGLPR